MSDTESGTSSAGTVSRSARQGDRPAGSVLVRARWGHAFDTGHEGIGVIDEHEPVAVPQEAADELIKASGGIVEIVEEN